MKVLCDRERLREGLAITTSVIPQKSTRPAVENVCLVATDDALELVGTDLDVAIRYRIDDVKIAEPGTALVPARVAADFVRDLSGETVTLATKGEGFVIESGSDRCELTTIDPEEFPVVARFEPEDSITLTGGAFARLVGRTSFAAAREQGRYAMHGLLTVFDGERLEIVATDGRRLAMGSTAVESDGKTHANQRAIVPTKAMQLFCRVIDDPLEPVKIHFGDSQFGLRTSKAELFARLIDGEFPRYQSVVPEVCKNRVEANAALFAQKLRLVSNVTANDTRSVRLSLDTGVVTLFGRSAATGEATAKIEADFEGTPGDVAFNPDFLLDGLKHCELDRVRFEFDERTAPGKFTLGENFIYIVMPITVDV